jgi:hypothetical protein
MVVRLLPCIWLLVAAWPPDELREAALLPLLRWPELPCWLAPVRELPCCWLELMPEPDWLLESCVCASWTRPAAGSAETGPATATAAAAPKMTANIRIFFSPGGVPPRKDNPAADIRFPRPAKILDERMFIFARCTGTESAQS